MALIRTYPFGKADKVWLSYEPENVRAREIYRKYGFVENGEMCGMKSLLFMICESIRCCGHQTCAAEGQHGNRSKALL